MSLEMLLEQFDGVVETAEDVEKLRLKILKWATIGKLGTQNPSDESASLLVQRINKQISDLANEGLISNLKTGKPIKENEVPHPLPNGWVWSRLGNSTYIILGQSPPSSTYNEDAVGLPFYQGKAEFGELYPTPQKWCSSPKKIAEKNDILMSVRAPVGPTNLCNETSCIGRGLAAIRCIGDLSVKYMLYRLRAIEDEISGEGFGTTFNAITGRDLRNFFIPIPPFKEQKRIVAKVDQLLAQTRQLAAQLTQTNTLRRKTFTALNRHLTRPNGSGPKTAWPLLARSFDQLLTEPETVDDLKQTILQLAVQGRLVPQDPNDEPASVLLERITAERQELIKLGKLIKEKKLPPILESKKPYSLPPGWIWARFPELGELNRGKSKHRPRNAPFLYENGIYPFVQTGEVARSNGRITSYTQTYNENGLAQSRMWPAGTLCITIAANIAETGILDFEACFPDR